MNKFEKLKELKSSVEESKDKLQDFAKELSFSTTELTGNFRTDGVLVLLDRNTNANLLIKENDAQKLHEFLKEIFEVNDIRITTQKLAENIVKSAEKQKKLENG